LRRLARDSQQFLSSFRRPLSARRRPGPEEAIQGERSQAEIAWAYEGHPVTVSNWTTQFMEEGAKVFGGVGRAETPAEKDRRPRATCEGQLDLVKKRLASGGSFGVLEAFSTDENELCGGESRSASVPEGRPLAHELPDYR
jgi:transposase-like protein